MDINKYFIDKLKSLSKIDITDDEKKMLSFGQMEQFITKRILSRKFRRNVLKEESIKLIKEKIALSVNNNKPIYLIFGFGGYKNHWVEDVHPKVGWAEFFHLLYISELLAPIAKVYEPGVIIEYESEGEAGIYHNNVSKEDIDTYTESFKKLEEYMKKYVPNVDFRYNTLPEQYDTDIFFKKVLKLVPKKVKELRESLKGGMEQALKRPLFNLKRDGVVDYTKTSKKELNEIALKSLAFNNVFLDEDFKMRSDYFEGEERIPMIGSYCTDNEWITINSCARSTNAFWTSKGVLFKVNEGYQENILGPNAYEKIKKRVKIEKINLFKGELEYLNKIPVITT